MYKISFVFSSTFSLWLSPGHGAEQAGTLNTAFLPAVKHALLMFDCTDNDLRTCLAFVCKQLLIFKIQLRCP